MSEAVPVRHLSMSTRPTPSSPRDRFFPPEAPPDHETQAEEWAKAIATVRAALPGLEALTRASGDAAVDAFIAAILPSPVHPLQVVEAMNMPVAAASLERVFVGQGWQRREIGTDEYLVHPEIHGAAIRSKSIQRAKWRYDESVQWDRVRGVIPRPWASWGDVRDERGVSRNLKSLAHYAGYVDGVVKVTGQPWDVVALGGERFDLQGTLVFLRKLQESHGSLLERIEQLGISTADAERALQGEALDAGVRKIVPQIWSALYNAALVIVEKAGQFKVSSDLANRDDAIVSFCQNIIVMLETELGTDFPRVMPEVPPVD